MSGMETGGVGDGGNQQTFRSTNVQCRPTDLGYTPSIEENIKNKENGGPTGGPILLK